MADETTANPLPELSQLIETASRASFSIDADTKRILPQAHRQALVALVDFVCEYHDVIAKELEN